MVRPASQESLPLQRTRNRRAGIRAAGQQESQKTYHKRVLCEHAPENGCGRHHGVAPTDRKIYMALRSKSSRQSKKLVM